MWLRFARKRNPERLRYLGHEEENPFDRKFLLYAILRAVIAVAVLVFIVSVFPLGTSDKCLNGWIRLETESVVACLKGDADVPPDQWLETLYSESSTSFFAPVDEPLR